MSGTDISTTRWESVERWSPTLFLGAGTLVLGSLANNSLTFLAEMSGPETLSLGLTLAGFVTALVGVAGFYPELKVRTPRLALTSLTAVAGAAVGLVALFVWALAIVGLSVPEPSPAVALPVLLLMLAAYLLFGVAIVRTDAYPRTVGLLLLALVGVFVVVFARGVVIGGEPSELFTVVSEGFESTLLLGIGYLVHTRDRRTGAEDPSPA